MDPMASAQARPGPFSLETALQSGHPGSARMTEILDLAHLGLWELDHASGRLFWSDGIYALFELDRERFGASYDAFLATIHPEDRERVDESFRDAVANRMPYDVVHRLLMPDGRVKWVRECCRTSYGPDGAPVRSIGTVGDFTAQQEAEAAHARQDAIRNVLLESYPGDALLISPGRRILAVNARTRDSMGLSDADLVGRDAFASLPPGAVDDCRNAFAQAIATKRPVRFESEAFGRVVHNTVSPILDPRSDVEAVIVATYDLTALRRTEASLRESEARYRLISENATDVILVLDAGTERLTFASPSIRTLLGIGVEQAGARSFKDHIAEESLGTALGVLADLRREIAGEKPMESARFELGLVRADGDRIHVEVEASPFLDADGTWRVLLVLRDVSERIRIGAELQRYRERLERLVEERTTALGDTEARFRALFEASLDAMYVVELNASPGDSRFVEVNPAACRLWGIDRVSFLSLTRDRLPCLRRSRTLPEIRALLLADGSDVFEETVAGPGGIETTLEINSHAISFRGRPHALSVARDVTRRIAAEAEVRRIGALSDAALGLTRSGYWQVPLDGTGGFTLSDRAVEIFGLPGRPDRTYRLAEDWIEPMRAADADAAERTAAAFAAFAEGRTTRYDQVYGVRRPSDGRTVWMHAIGEILPGRGGAPDIAFGAVQDITAQREMEADLQRAMEAAQAASRAKSSFLSHMSHEIRTPMNAILGFTQLSLNDPDLTERQRGRLKVISRSGDHLLSLINEILEMSRIEAGQSRLSPSRVDLCALAADLEDMFRLRVAEKGIACTTSVAPDVPRRIVADELKVRGILINLLNNAVKFTEQGGISLRLSRSPRPEGGGPVAADLLVAEVEDTGVGIPDEEAATLFAPFFQTPAGTRMQGGTGLGLAISLSHARLMGGSVAYRPRAGGGSVFRFELPIEEPEEGEFGCLEGETASVDLGNGRSERVPEAADSRDAAERADAELPPEPLDLLRVEEVEALRAAARAARIDELLDRIAGIAGRAPRLAARLRRLAADYRYEGILAMLRRV